MHADGSIGQDNAAAGECLDALQAAMLVCCRCREAPLKVRLPHEPRPIFRLSGTARLVIASQAPGIRAHLSGIPFKDPSGMRLRAWLGLDEAEFYDESRLMILPMGFCFPGHDAQGGDLPPRGECRLAWHDRLFAALPQVETVLAIGLPSLRYHVPRLAPDRLPVRSLTEAVEDWRRYFERPAPRLLPLPHPSWRNSGWLKRHPWFEADLLPVLRREVGRLM